jgi:Glycosyltransferase
MIKPKLLRKDLKDYVLSVGTDVHRDIELLDKLAYNMQDKTFILCSCNPKYLNKNYKSDNLKVISANLCEMRYLYKYCSCVIIPLKYNDHVSGCTTLLEAAAMKKPVVISDIPGIRDYVLNNKTGIITPIGDVNSFENAILKLVNDKNYAQILGNNAYKYTNNRFTTENWALEHAKISKDILNIK